MVGPYGISDFWNNYRNKDKMKNSKIQTPIRKLLNVFFWKKNFFVFQNDSIFLIKKLFFVKMASKQACGWCETIRLSIITYPGAPTLWQSRKWKNATNWHFIGQWTSPMTFYGVKYFWKIARFCSGNPYWRGRLSTVDLLIKLVVLWKRTI